MKSIIYDKELDLFCRTYLVKGNEHMIKNVNNFRSDYKRITENIAEHLLYHDGIAFSLVGENISAAILINMFGLKGFEQLLEKKAIKFIQDNQIITYLVDDIEGIEPLQSGYINSIAHNDLEKSAYLGLGWMSDPLERKQRRVLARKIVKNYEHVPDDISANSVSFGHEGYKNNLFENLGLTNSTSISSLDTMKRKQLCVLAGQCKDLAIISHFKLSTFNATELYNIHREEVRNLRDIGIDQIAIDKLFEIERLPNFKQMLNTGIINMQDIPIFNGSKNASNFKQWIRQAETDADATSITLNYLNSISSGGKLDSVQGKFFRTLIVSGISASAGGLVAGGIGALSAGMIGNAISLGISLLDTYLVSGLASGWNPRHYFDIDLRSKLLKNKI